MPDIDERQGYDTVWFGFSVGDDEFTLCRSVAGGNFKLYEGLVTGPREGATSSTLGAKHDHKKPGNLSNFLLARLGFGGKFIAKDTFGSKNSLSFRNLARLLLVDETSIQAERSPIEGGQRGDVPTERSVFRLLLSGADDSAVVPVEKPKAASAAKATKLGLLDEMIDDVDRHLATEHPEADGYAEQDARLSETLDRIQKKFEIDQKSIRGLLARKQALASEIPRVGGRLDEIGIHLDRFARLSEVYDSDIERLVAIEEAGFLVSLANDKDCPLCGAKPEAQSHAEGLAQIEQVKAAALAEVAKINRQRDDLGCTVADLEAERGGVEQKLERLEQDLEETERQLEELLPKLDENPPVADRRAYRARRH